MKSAYELALERLGGLKSYTQEQKKRLAEIDKVYDAKRAEITLRLDEKLKSLAGDPDAVTKEETLRREAASELARLEEKRESEKNRIRNHP